MSGTAAATPVADAAPPGALTWDQAAATAGKPAAADAAAPLMTWDEAAKLPPAKETAAAVPPGAVTGMGANIAAGAAEGGAGAINTSTDLFGNLVGNPLDRLFPWAYNLGARVFGYKPASPEDIASWQGMTAKQGGSALVEAGAHAVGLPAPSEVVPGSTQEAIARAGTAAAVSLPLTGVGGGTAAGTAKAAAIGAEMGAAGQTFSEMVPDEWKDPVNIATQFAVPLVHAGVAPVVRPVTSAVRTAVGPVFGRREAVLDPVSGQPIQQTAGGLPGQPGPVLAASPAEQRLAAQRVAQRMGQTPSEAAATMGTLPEPPVAGAQPTLGELTGNTGTLAYERQLRASPYGRQAFAERDAQRQVAQVAALQGAAPADVGEAAGNWFRTKLDAIEAQNEAEARQTGAAAAAARADTGAEGVLPSAQDEGARIRTQIEADREPLKKALGAGYDALDKDGTLAQDTTPVSDAARAIRDAAGKRPDFFPGEQDRLADAEESRGVQTFASLRQQQTNLSAILRRIRANPEYGAESQPYRRMSQLLAATHDAIAAAAARAVTREMTSNPAPGERIVDQLTGADRNGGTPAAGAGGPGGEVAGEPAAGGAPVAPGAGGAPSPGGAAPPVGGGPAGGAAGDRAVAPQATAPAKPTVNLGIPPPTREPEDAFSFIRSKGGVQPSQHLTDDANRVVLSSAWGNRPGGKLVDPKGMSLNHMREALAEEGWLTGAAGKDEHAAAEFINNVAAEHVAGRKVYRPEDEAIAEQYEQQRHAEAMRAHAQEGYRDQVLDVEDRAGMRLSDAEIDHAVNLMSDDPTLHPEEAVRQAAMAGEEVALQVNAQRNAFGRPGMPQAEQDALQLPAFGHNGGPPLEENYPPSTDKDLREINRRYADYKNTYRSGAVGEVLASGKGPGGFKLNDSAVPGKLFKPGPGGAEAADSLIKQAGGVREAAARLGDYPALLFRNEVMPNGVVDPARYARFQAKYAAALDKFPTIAAKFRTAAEAQRQVEAAAARGEAKIAQFQRNAASAYLTKAGDVVDPGRAITKLLNSDNVGQSFRNLMRDAAGNDAAVDGIRRNLLDEIVRRGSTTKEAGQSGVRALGKGNYQRVINDPKMAAAIKEVLPPASQRILRNVSEDMDLMDRAMNVAKVPGSPGTAADLRAMVEHGGPEGLTAFWLLMAGEKVAEVLGWVSGSGPVTRAILETTGAFGANMLRVKRAAALENVEKVATEMVLQPNTLGRVLMERLARERPDQFSRRIAHRVMQAVSGTAIAAQPSGARSP